MPKWTTLHSVLLFPVSPHAIHTERRESFQLVYPVVFPPPPLCGRLLQVRVSSQHFNDLSLEMLVGMVWKIEMSGHWSISSAAAAVLTATVAAILLISIWSDITQSR